MTADQPRKLRPPEFLRHLATVAREEGPDDAEMLAIADVFDAGAAVLESPHPQSPEMLQVALAVLTLGKLLGAQPSDHTTTDQGGPHGR